MVMGGNAINEKRGLKEAMEILKKLDFPIDRPWRYDPHFMIGIEKGRKHPNLQDH
jgi:hypothetical protein